MSPISFRIAWRVLNTGQQGHGQYCFNFKQEAEEFALGMNKEYKDEINHWVETKEAIPVQVFVFQVPKTQNLKTLVRSCVLPRGRGKARSKNASIFLKMT